MNATNARALNTFRQRIRKNNREYEDEIKKYREDPEAFDQELEIEAQLTTREVRDEITVDGKSMKGFLAPEEDDEGFSTVGRGGRITTYTAEGIFKHLKMIFEARGKRNTDRAEQVRILEKLREVATTSYAKIRVLLALISARFDYNPIAPYMPIDQWSTCVP
jgi:translation initiation factor 3 subunit C